MSENRKPDKKFQGGFELYKDSLSAIGTWKGGVGGNHILDYCDLGEDSMTEGDIGDSDWWRVMGKPIDSMSLVTRIVEADTREQAKEKYLESIGHKQVFALRARSENTVREQREGEP